jgi:hypothetical protein
MLGTILLVTVALFLLLAFRRWSQGAIRANQGPGGITFVLVVVFLIFA